MNTSKQINVMVLLVFVAVFLTGAYTLWDPNRADDAEKLQLEKTVDRGAYLFSQNCRQCHGDSGEGGAAANRLRQAPPLNRPDLQGKNQAGERTDTAYAGAFKLIYNTITCGRVGKVMPSWAQAQGGTLNEEQIKQLTVFITEGTGWAQAKEFAQRGDPAFKLHGDDQYGLSLAAPLAEGDTTVTLNRTKDAVNPGDRLAIGDELLSVTGVDNDANTATVERGVGTTSPAAHEQGAEVLHPPPAPQDPAIVKQACGQTAQAQSTAVAEPPSATLSITAQGTAWSKATLSALQDQPLTITVENKDDGTPHNWHLFNGADLGSPEFTPPVMTQIQNGPNTETVTFGPLPAGTYYYVCDVHPQMEGQLTAGPAGAAPGPAAPGVPAGGGTAGSSPSGAASTPAAAGTATATP